MRAWVLKKRHSSPELLEVATPTPKEDELLIAIDACALCRTDLHILDDELPNPKLPLILGHQIVGTVTQTGAHVTRFKVGDHVGVPWLAKTCGKCSYCLSQRENLCDNALFTGYTKDGGFAEFCVASEQFTFPLPKTYSGAAAAPLLCSGMIGYRALKLLKGAKNIGFFGFGASAHLLIQVINHQGGSVYVFTRPHDEKKQKEALALGAKWAGDSTEPSPILLDAIIIFATVGELFPHALRSLRKGGIALSAGIHMSDIPSFPYSLLWEERSMTSVANLTRQDGDEFLTLAPKIPIETEVKVYPFTELNKAIADVRRGEVKGSAVLRIRENGE